MSYKLPEENGLKEMLDMIIGDDAALTPADPCAAEDLSFFARSDHLQPRNSPNP